jgi:LuxR family transcriptional regulator, maltose regulon positive regulatory protein
MENRDNRWLIQTKLAPPTQAIKRIKRDQKQAHLPNYQNYRLCIVHAFAGYGKTTFLQDWYEFQKTRCGATVWLSLDEADAQVGTFFSYLVAALSKAEVPCELLRELAERDLQQLPARSLASALIDTFYHYDKPITLFLDDYQRATSEAVDKFMYTVISYAPDNVNIVIASRVYPSFSIENLRAQGNLMDISAETLRFSENELSALCDNVLSPSDLHLLWERTEGWPIACQMANYLLQQNMLTTEEIEKFTGQTRELSTYISEQVFQTLSEDEQLFLMVTSVAERFTGDLADHLHDDLDAWTILEQLEQKKLFLVPLDGHGGWYRYHQLFAQYLYEKLQRKFRDKVKAIHRKASLWLFDNGYTPEAVNQALIAEDPALAAEQLDKAGGWRLTFQGKLDFMRTILTQLPADIVESFPRLHLTSIIKLIREGNIIEAKEKARAFREKSLELTQWRDQPLPEDIRLEWIAVTDLLMGSYADVPATDERLQILQTLAAQVDREDSTLIGIIHGCLIHQHWERGDITLAIKAHTERTQAIAHGQPTSTYWFIYNCINISILDVEQCKLRQASQELNRAKPQVDKNPNLDFNLTAAVSVFLAELAYLRNDIFIAESLLTPALNHLEKYDASFKHYAPAFVTMVGISRVTADRQAVLNVLERGYHVADTRQLPRLKTLCDILMVKYLLLAGELTEAEQAVKKARLNDIIANYPCASDLSVYLPELATLALARLHIVKGETREANNLLQPLPGKMEQQNRLRILVEVYLLQARAAMLLGDRKTATSLVGKAVFITMHEDYQRAFIDEGKAGIELYEAALEDDKKTNQYFTNFLKDVIQACKKELKRIASRSSGLNLADMEYQVIVELAKGYSNKQIARVLNVPEDSVKYQLRKVYKKWRINTRDAAAKIAQEKLLNKR